MSKQQEREDIRTAMAEFEGKITQLPDEIVLSSWGDTRFHFTPDPLPKGRVRRANQSPKLKSFLDAKFAGAFDRRVSTARAKRKSHLVTL